MNATLPLTRRAELRIGLTPAAVCRALRRTQPVNLFLDGAGGFDDAWLAGPLVAVGPSQVLRTRARSAGEVDVALDRLGEIVTARRAAGGGRETGVAALLSYEFLDGAAAGHGSPADLVVLTVDHSLSVGRDGTVLLTSRGADGPDAPAVEGLSEQLCAASRVEPPRAARCAGRPSTSLPRGEYLRAVRRVKEHIACGDVYQANLCQRFSIGYTGDPFEAFVELARATPAPRSAFLETAEFALASVSPETFLLECRPGILETRPIKGTRPRGRTTSADHAAAERLLHSEKDRAELLMIVDLERNDLSRVCDAGTVEVPELVGLRSYAAVHHLVARVRGRLAAGVGIPALLRATFPGGSITGAPKIRAMQILRGLEPARRGFFTGSLLWFGDDGSMDSSILIRSWVFDRVRAWLGAGGGIVADSDPESEWLESNHKARALAAALGFDPEEAK